MNNAVTGNSAANQLDGLTGSDTLTGGLGHDIYVVDNTGDVVTELAGQGVDLVQSVVTYALTTNVEKLTLTGTAAINGTGNASNNVLTGNGAANQLNGLAGSDTLAGGAGKDALTGGLGNDFFVFNAALSASTNIDTIKDYTTAADTIRLENAIFTKLTAIGTLSPANFKVGAAAADANDFIVYNNSTGALYYDADGTGATAAIQFATVYSSGTTPATLTAAEFVVI